IVELLTLRLITVTVRMDTHAADHNLPLKRLARRRRCADGEPVLYLLQHNPEARRHEALAEPVDYLTRHRVGLSAGAGVALHLNTHLAERLVLRLLERGRLTHVDQRIGRAGFACRPAPKHARPAQVELGERRRDEVECRKRYSVTCRHHRGSSLVV